MTRPGRGVRAGLAAVAAGVLLLAAGCGSDPSPAEPTARPSPAPPPPAPPKQGACFSMSMRQAVAPTASGQAGPCGRAHTTETYLVGPLDTVVDGHLVAVDSDRVSAQVAATCRRHLTGFLGGTPDQARMTMVRAVWFTPTVAESDRGASWFRCDAVVVAGSNALASRKGSLKGVLRSEAGRRSLAMCGTDAPSAKDFHRVLCSAKHSWRVTAVVPLKDGKYPGPKAAKAAGQTRCEDAAAGAASDPLSFQWSYEWPTAEDWAQDQHYGLCWAKGS